MNTRPSLARRKLQSFTQLLLLLMTVLNVIVPETTFAAGTRVVVVGSAIKVRPTDVVQGSDKAELLAARNEFESFQIVVHAGDQPLTGMRVELVTPLSAQIGTSPYTIPANNVVIYREEYYTVQTPSDLEGAMGAWPDALIPAVDPYFGEARRAFPIDVPAGQNRVAWIDILVPQGFVPAIYRGTLRVTANNGLAVDVPVALEVVDVVLPSTSSLSSSFNLTASAPCAAHYGSCATNEQGWALNALYARAALDNRISISTPNYRPLRGSADIDAFNRHIVPLLKGTAPTRLPGATLTTIRTIRGKSLTSGTEQARLDALAELQRWKDLATQHSFAGRAFVEICDEPGKDTLRWNACKQASTEARAVWGNVPMLVTAPIQYATQNAAVPAIDWLVPLVNHMDGKSSTFAGNQRGQYDSFLQGDSANKVWMYTSCMSFGCLNALDTETLTGCRSQAQESGVHDSTWDGWAGYAIDAPASQSRAMGWLSFIYRTTGELYWDTVACLPSAWSAIWRYGGNGDGTLFYPGKAAEIGGTRDIPLESMRLKLIRDGYEDYELLKLVEQRAGRQQAEQIALRIFSHTYSTTQTDAALQQARRDLFRAMDKMPTTNGSYPFIDQYTSCSTLMMRVSAEDDLRLKKVEYYFDGQVRWTYDFDTNPEMFGGAYLSDYWALDLSPLLGSSHTYKVQATDRSGNVSTTSGQFEVWRQEHVTPPENSVTYSCGVK